MFFRSTRKVLPKHMSSIAATICRIPNARFEIPARIRVSSRTVENWLSGATEPKACHLIALMREFDEVVDDVLRAADRQQGGLTHEQTRKVREALEAIGEK